MNLLNKCYDHSSSIILIQWKKDWKYDIRLLYFNEESYYPEENTSDNEVFAPPFFNHFSLSLNREKRVVRSYEKETKPIHASAADLLHIRKGSLNWSAREASCHPAFMGMGLTINHTCWPYLPSRWVLPFFPGVVERNREAGWI